MFYGSCDSIKKTAVLSLNDYVFVCAHVRAELDDLSMN